MGWKKTHKSTRYGVLHNKIGVVGWKLASEVSYFGYMKVDSGVSPRQLCSTVQPRVFFGNRFGSEG